MAVGGLIVARFYMLTGLLSRLSTYFYVGDEYASYNGPAPPDRQPHYYYFLLYKQQAEVSVAVLSSYTGDCPARLATR